MSASLAPKLSFSTIKGSDNIDYAIQAKRIIQAACKESNGFSKNRGERPITKYEKKALSKNKFVFDLIYTKN